MFVANATKTVSLKTRQVGDAERLAGDRFAGITQVDVVANLTAATSGMPLTRCQRIRLRFTIFDNPYAGGEQGALSMPCKPAR